MRIITSLGSFKAVLGLALCAGLMAWGCSSDDEDKGGDSGKQDFTGIGDLCRVAGGSCMPAPGGDARHTCFEADALHASDSDDCFKEGIIADVCCVPIGTGCRAAGGACTPDLGGGDGEQTCQAQGGTHDSSADDCFTQGIVPDICCVPFGAGCRAAGGACTPALDGGDPDQACKVRGGTHSSEVDDCFTDGIVPDVCCIPSK